MVSPTQLCWRYHGLPLSQKAFHMVLHIISWKNAPLLMSISYTTLPDSKVHGANVGPTWADRTQVGPMLATWILLSGWLSNCLYFSLLMFLSSQNSRSFEYVWVNSMSMEYVQCLWHHVLFNDRILCIQLVIGFIAWCMLSHFMYFARNDEINIFNQCKIFA